MSLKGLPVLQSLTLVPHKYFKYIDQLMARFLGRSLGFHSQVSLTTMMVLIFFLTVSGLFVNLDHALGLK